MNSPLVTVIVPAYNAEAFLEECLGSIQAQTYRNLEVIVVNDGSTDSTEAIAQRAGRSDRRFRTVSIPNGGVSRARNTGIELARGVLITFVDADDRLHPEALKTMTDSLLENDAEICITAFAASAPESNRRPKSIVYDYMGAMKDALYQKRLLNSPWGVLINRNFLGDRRFREGIRYEDLDAFYRFYEGAKKIIYLDFPFYLYRHNPLSFINNWSEARLDVLDVTDRMADFFASRYPALRRAALDRRFSAHFNMLLLMKKHRVTNPEAMRRCREAVRRGRAEALKDPEVRIKNKIGALLSYLFL